MSGNLGYQVEHHLYPDMPSTRYGEIAPRVREICTRYELPYNTGPLWKQWGMVQRTIVRLAFPGGKPRPEARSLQGREDHRPAASGSSSAAAELISTCSGASTNSSRSVMRVISNTRWTAIGPRTSTSRRSYSLEQVAEHQDRAQA